MPFLSIGWRVIGSFTPASTTNRAAAVEVNLFGDFFMKIKPFRKNGQHPARQPEHLISPPLLQASCLFRMAPEVKRCRRGSGALYARPCKGGKRAVEMGAKGIDFGTCFEKFHGETRCDTICKSSLLASASAKV